MNIDKLSPPPIGREAFNRSRLRNIPSESGCYALTTFSREVLYIGLTVNLRNRMNNHLDNPAKNIATPSGRAVLFYWLTIEAGELNKLERTWLNIHVENEGKFPLLNKMFSPTAT